jgi:hypothetical protein
MSSTSGLLFVPVFCCQDSRKQGQSDGTREPLDRLLGSSTLVVESAGEYGQLRLTEIPNA